MSGLIDQWPRPRVGQVVKLHDGRRGTVVVVRKANAVLKAMGEGEALLLSANQRARFGQNWREVYYQADIIFQTGVLHTIDTSHVESIHEPT